ncbi:MAG: sulfatase [Abitibacteriaceae bacterium]|nr:sulfatase [Abditibacteriaceae bacterium]
MKVLLPLLALIAMVPHSALRAAPAPPNIVLILIDDMGYGDVGPFGSKQNRTPAIDRMAREGMKLTSFYAAPVCSVSRAQVMTGCYGQRVSVPGVFQPASRNGISDQEHTVAELLRARGYATMCIGKWHLGDQPPFLPTRHGFDSYFGLPYSNDMMPKAKATGTPVVPLMRDDKVIELLTGEGQNQLTQRYTDEAIKFMRAHQHQPFFLYLPHTAVHVPIHPGARFRGKSPYGRYSDWVEEVDWSVGRVLNTLNELKLASHTLVLFTSDNGPWLTQGADAGSAGPLRGGKGSTWEGGMREPTIAWWPGKIAPGAVCDAVAGNIDLLPTFVQLAGGTVPQDKKIDGRDIMPLLLGQTHVAPREAHFYYNNYQLEAVRAGPWKLALRPQPEGMGKPEPPDATSPGLRLYNLDTDIGERTNVADAHPDVVQRLQRLAAQMIADLGDGRRGPGVRPAGVVAHPTTLYPVALEADDASAGSPVAVGTLKIGDAVGKAAAPQVAHRPITISCDVEAKAPNGVIVAQGGSAVGYALYLKDGHVAFVVRTAGDAATTIVAPVPLTTRTHLEARLQAGGAMTLLIAGGIVATGKAPGLLDRQPQEDFCVGFDNQKPVGHYDGATHFQGSIEHLQVATDARP